MIASERTKTTSVRDTIIVLSDYFRTFTAICSQSMFLSPFASIYALETLGDPLEMAIFGHDQTVKNHCFKL